MQITVYCVATETEGSGQVDWYFKEQDAVEAYRETVNNSAYNDATVTRFNLMVDDGADPETVTQLADAAMWEMDYTAIEQRVGTDGVSVKKTDAANAATA